MQFIIISIFFCFFLEPWQLFGIGNFGVTPMKAMLFVFILFVLKRTIWNGEKLKIAIKPAAFCLIGLAVSAVLSGLYPLFQVSDELILQFAKSSTHFFLFLSFCFLAFSYPIKPSIWKNGLQVWLGSSLLINIFGIYQIAARAFQWPFAWISFTNVSLKQRGNFKSIEDFGQLSLSFEKFFRATSIFTEPAVLAMFNLFIFALIIVPYINGTKPFFKSKVLSISIFIFSIISLFLAFSLLGVLGLIMILSVIFLFEKRKRINEILSILLIAIALVLVSDRIVENYAEISVTKLFQQRIGAISGKKDNEQTRGESFNVRVYSVEVTIKNWLKSPITGIGLGNISHVSKEISFSDMAALECLSEMGIIGFLTFSGLFYFGFSYSLPYIRNPNLSLKFDKNEPNLPKICLYFLVILFLISFISGNFLIGNPLWIPMAYVLSTLNSTLIASGKEYYSIRLISKPLAEYFYPDPKTLQRKIED